MCYHTSHPDEAAIRKHFKSIGSEYTGDRIYHTNAFKRWDLPVTISDQPNMVISGRYGFIPPWANTPEKLKKVRNTENARGEEMFDKNTFRSSAKSKRGLLYVDGFWEPHEVTGNEPEWMHETGKKGEKNNYYLYLPEKEIFTLGIVWNEYNGDITFAVVTTNPNEQLAVIHNRTDSSGNPDPRMPLVVNPQDRQEWLESRDEVGVKMLVKPWEQEFQFHKTVRVTAMTKQDTNYPSIQDPI